VPVLDGIVCAAGVYFGGPLPDAADDEIRRALDINLMGAVTVVKELHSLLGKGSRVVLVSSGSTRVAVPFTGPYVMSK
jgi:NAD(P)-dependent dehydrogenase (short-subunit alcohol dehydrogenase family)